MWVWAGSARHSFLLPPRLQLAHRFRLQLCSVRSADQPIQDRASHARVATVEVVVPAIYRQLAGDERRTRAAALFDHLQQIVAGAGACCTTSSRKTELDALLPQFEVELRPGILWPCYRVRCVSLSLVTDSPPRWPFLATLGRGGWHQLPRARFRAYRRGIGNSSSACCSSLPPR